MSNIIIPNIVLRIIREIGTKMLNLFEGLEKRGLELSKSASIDIPLMQKPKHHLLSSITQTMHKRQSQSQILIHEAIVTNFLNEYFLVGQANILILYKYSIQEEGLAPIIEELAAQAIQHSIDRVWIFARKYMLDKGELPVILQSQNTLIFCTIDLRQKRFLIKDELKCSDIISLNFFSESQLVVLTRDDLVQVKIVSRQKLVIGQRISNSFKLDSNQVLLNGKIVGKIDQDKDCQFRIVLCTLKGTTESIKVKEYVRSVDRGLKAHLQIYIASVISHSQRQRFNLANATIQQIEEYICIQANSQILVIKKKFNKYLKLDSLIQNTNGKQLYLSQEGIICSVSSDSFSVNYIKFADPKCECKLLDEITLEERNKYGNFKSMWLFQYNKEPSIMFLFEKEGKLSLASLVKTEPMSKLIRLIDIRGKKDIKIVQELGQNLGIPKKQFYLKLWASSNKETVHLYQYLLPCQDVKSIKTEVGSFLRKRAIPVSQMLKILDKISLMLHKQFKTSLSQTLLKQYAKNNFLRRKIKLYAVDRIVDCKVLDAIYNSSILDMFVCSVSASLFPKKQTHDPMLSMVQITNIHQETNLKHVLQQFKLCLLQHYKQFLSDLFMQFPGEISKVLSNYSYLLPNYPFSIEIVHGETHLVSMKGQDKDKTSASTPQNSRAETNHHNIKKQDPWFSEVNNGDWQRQLNRNQVQTELHKYYSTSKIASTIDSFLLKDYGKKNLMKTHCMINTHPLQFEKVVDELRGVKLYLFVCQVANNCALKHGKQTTEASSLVNIFEKHHGLSGQDLEDCRLYSEMHFFMMKHKILEEEDVSIEKLIEMSKQPENLVALFFLGNRQKKEFVLSQFRNLYRTIYQFNQVIQSFVESDNCSKIELLILLGQVVQKGIRFQEENQELINIIVNAFCMKLEIRETRSIESFLRMISEVEIDRTLSFKVNKIANLKNCNQLLSHFKWETKTYEWILRDSRKTLEDLLESYLSEQLLSTDVKINQEELTLEYPRNMLNILLYLKEYIFYQISQIEVLEIFGFALIQWKQFQTIRSMVYEEAVPLKLNACPNQYIKSLVNRCLYETIYRKQGVAWTDEIKQQIEMILSLIDKNSTDRIRQQAKVQLMQIFISWGYAVAPSQIWLMSQQWKEADKSQIMHQIITQYIDNLDFRVLRTVYRVLDTIEREAKGLTNFQSTDFTNYCLYFCNSLMQKHRYKEVLEVVAYLKSLQNIAINYNLITEAFLQSLTNRHQGQQNLHIAKSFVEFYTQYFEVDQQIKTIFENYLEESLLQNWCQYKQVLMDNILCFPGGDAIIKTDDLFTAAFDEESAQETIYNYYYLLMGVRIPQYALIRIQSVSYSLDSLIKSLQRLEVIIEDNPYYWGVNIYEFYKGLRKGIYMEALTRMKTEKWELRQNPDEVQLEMIKNLLKKDKQDNGQLLRQLNKIQNHMNHSVKIKIEERKKRFDHKLIQVRKLEHKQSCEETQEDIPIYINVTIKYRDVSSKKTDISKQFQYITEKEIIDQIFDEALQNKVIDKHGKNNTSINSVTSLGLQRSRMERYCNLLQAVMNKEFAKVNHDYTSKEIEKALQAIYVRPSITIQQMMDSLEELGVGDPHKIKVGRLFPLHQTQITDQALKQIFTFDFFIRELKIDFTLNQNLAQEVTKNIFDSIKNSLRKFLYEKKIEQAISIANFFQNIMGNKSYKQQVLFVGVEGIVLSKDNSPRTLRRLRDYLRFLAEDQVFFQHQIKSLLIKQKIDPQSDNTLKDSLKMISKLPKSVKKLLLSEGQQTN